MKAAELLRLYKAGERDFKGVNLRGENFKGKDLSGTDFSGADIRSANFTNANLIGTNFTHAKAGLQWYWIVGKLLVAFLLLFFAVSSLFLLSSHVELLFLADNTDALVYLIPKFASTANTFEMQTAGWAALASAAGIYFLFWRKGIGCGTLSVCMFLNVFSLSIGIFSSLVSEAEPLLGWSIASIVGWFLAFSLLEACVAVSITCFVEVLVLSVAGTFLGIGVVTLYAGCSLYWLRQDFSSAALVGTLVLLVANTCLSWRALSGDPRDIQIRSTAIMFAAFLGTSFYRATLTDANFSRAYLKNSDLRWAILKRTNWYNTSKIDQSRLSGTILIDPVVRELIVSHRDVEKSYEGLDLQGANLLDVNLSGANLGRADLREALLSGAGLNRANLRKTDLSGADLRGADLRGANLAGCVLCNADLSNTNLAGADLSGADLEEANLSGAVLRGASLTNANLLCARVGNTNLDGATLAGACLVGTPLATQ